MQRLIPRKDEPKRPFVERVRALADRDEVSTILVAGGSGAYFDVADVVRLKAYAVEDVTGDAKRMAAELGNRGEVPSGKPVAMEDRRVGILLFKLQR
jgi:predicted ABC-class ATPase